MIVLFRYSQMNLSILLTAIFQAIVSGDDSYIAVALSHHVAICPIYCPDPTLSSLLNSIRRNRDTLDKGSGLQPPLSAHLSLVKYLEPQLRQMTLDESLVEQQQDEATKKKEMKKERKKERKKNKDKNKNKASDLELELVEDTDLKTHARDSALRLIGDLKPDAWEQILAEDLQEARLIETLTDPTRTPTLEEFMAHFPVVQGQAGACIFSCW